MKIAVDVDGVLLDLIGSFLQLFNRRYHTQYEPSDLDRYDFYHNWNVPKQQIYQIFFEIYKSKCETPLIDPTAPYILNHLNKDHHVDIVSARDSQFYDHLLRKLEDHGIIKGLSYRNLVLVEETPIDSKLAHRYDIYIDDNPNLIKPVQNLEDILLLLFNQPWNKSIEIVNGKVCRVHNWTEIIQTIRMHNLHKI